MKYLAAMNNRVLIVGCGGIGRRHLQALLSMGDRYEISVVDTIVEQQDLQLFVAQHCNGAKCPQIHRSLDQLPYTDFFAVILATTSNGRMAFLKDILTATTTELVICEKPLSNAVRDLALSCRFDHARVFVNYHRRYQRIYRSLCQSHFNKLKRMEFRSTELGLLCNFAHHLDAALMLNPNAGEIVNVRLDIQRILNTSRLGFNDVAGLLNIEFANGMTLVCNSMEDFDSNTERHLIATATNNDDSFVVNEEKGNLIIQGEVEQSSRFLLQSELTGLYLDDARVDEVKLPSLIETRRTFAPVLREITATLQEYSLANQLSRIQFT